MSSQTSQSVSFSEFQKKLYVPFGGTSHGFINRKSTSYRGVSEVRDISSYRERTYNFSRSTEKPMVTGRKRFVSNVVEGRLYINRIN